MPPAVVLDPDKQNCGLLFGLKSSFVACLIHTWFDGVLPPQSHKLKSVPPPESKHLWQSFPFDLGTWHGPFAMLLIVPVLEFQIHF